MPLVCLKKDLQGRCLNDPQPHRLRAWLTAKADPQFDEKVRHICALYQQAPALEAAGEVVFTSDEMTGVQALERLHPDKSMRPGEPLKREFEYIRHGTLSLIVHRAVASGQVVAPFAAPTREEEDFALSVVLAICARPEAKRWRFVVGRWGNDPGGQPEYSPIGDAGAVGGGSGRQV